MIAWIPRRRSAFYPDPFPLSFSLSRSERMVSSVPTTECARIRVGEVIMATRATCARLCSWVELSLQLGFFPFATVPCPLARWRVLAW